MLFKRLALLIATSLFVIVLASTSQAKIYSLGGTSGAQLHIGGGLALPIQPAASAAVTAGVFPPLLIKPVASATVSATTAVSVDQKIVVPIGVLSKPESFSLVGLFASNPTLYAAGTNLKFTWPASVATFAVSKSPRAGAAPVSFAGALGGNKMVYSERVAGKRFGGAGRFKLTQAGSAGLLAAPITLYAIAVPGPGNPACTHTALAGANPACVAALISISPATLAAPGATVAAPPVSTTPANAVPGIFIVKVDAAGLPALAFQTPNSNPGPTNAATSTGRPWTTGKISVIALAAAGAPETFVISGADSRTAGGSGVIQMVSGSMSDRVLSKANANRAWLRLVLLGGSPVPAVSPAMIAAGAGLMLLAAGFVVRRSASASA